MPVALKSKPTPQQELRDINELIVARKRYLREQEVLIAETVESGNTVLMGLTHDIILAKQQLRDIKTDIRTAAQDKVLLNEDLDNIRDDLQLLVVRTTFIGFTPAFG